MWFLIPLILFVKAVIFYLFVANINLQKLYDEGSLRNLDLSGQILSQ